MEQATIAHSSCSWAWQDVQPPSDCFLSQLLSQLLPHIAPSGISPFPVKVPPVNPPPTTTTKNEELCPFSYPFCFPFNPTTCLWLTPLIAPFMLPSSHPMIYSFCVLGLNREVKKIGKSKRDNRADREQHGERVRAGRELSWPDLLSINCWRLSHVNLSAPPAGYNDIPDLAWKGAHGVHVVSRCFVIPPLCRRYVGGEEEEEWCMEHTVCTHAGAAVAVHIWLNAWLTINNPTHNEIKMPQASATVLCAYGLTWQRGRTASWANTRAHVRTHVQMNKSLHLSVCGCLHTACVHPFTHIGRILTEEAVIGLRLVQAFST